MPGPLGTPECRGSNRFLADGAGVLWNIPEFLGVCAWASSGSWRPSRPTTPDAGPNSVVRNLEDTVVHPRRVEEARPADLARAPQSPRGGVGQSRVGSEVRARAQGGDAGDGRRNRRARAFLAELWRMQVGSLETRLESEVGLGRDLYQTVADGRATDPESAAETAEVHVRLVGAIRPSSGRWSEW